MDAFLIQVALCAGCNVVHPYAAFVIGIIAGMAYVCWSTVILRVKIDDPLDAVAGKLQQTYRSDPGNMQFFSLEILSPQATRSEDGLPATEF